MRAIYLQTHLHFYLEDFFMPDNRNSSPCFGGRDTVYIDTNRILDSCRDKDCFEDVPVYLTDVGNETVDRSSNARVKCAEVVSA